MRSTQPNQLVFSELATEVETTVLTEAATPVHNAKRQVWPEQAADAQPVATLVAPTATSAALTYPLPTGYAVYELAKVNQQTNCQRFYQVAYQPTLWTDHCLQRSWGRLGKKLRAKEQEFANEAEALKWLQRLLKRKLKRGYLLSQSTPVAEGADGSIGTEAISAGKFATEALTS